MQSRISKGINLHNFLDVPVTDPDDSRRRRLLNIILAGVIVLAFATSIVTFIMTTLGLIFTLEEAEIIYYAAIAMIIVSVIVYVQHRDCLVSTGQRAGRLRWS